MEDKKIYIVTADTYTGIYGIEMYFFGAYDELEKAQQIAKELEEKEHYCAQINKVTMNSSKEIYLGGYVE